MPARPSRGTSLVVSLVLLLTIVPPVGATYPTRLQPRTPADRPATDDVSTAEFVPGELLVRFAPGMSAAARQRAVDAAGGRVKRSLRLPDTLLVQLAGTTDIQAASTAIARRAGVVYVEPNYVYRIAATPDDPRFDDLWGLHSTSDRDIDAPEAWDVTVGSVDVTVAVIDTGVDYTHPDLADNVSPDGWDFVDGDSDPMDENGHGTHVAGTIGAGGNNGSGITGVAWDVTILPLRAGDEDGNFTNADVADAFDYACTQGARIVNGSFGGPQQSTAIRNAIQACPQALFVVAAGNGGNDGVGDNNDATAAYPCAYALSNIVCVAATGRNDRLTSFSNYGADSVDIAAPGESILSATPHRVFLSDGFESGLGDWVTNKTSGKSWSATTEAASNGNWSATDSAGASYANNSNTWMETASPFDLTGGSNCQLDYAFRLDTEPSFDRLFVEGSTNAGSSWQVIDGGLPGNQAWTGSTDGAFFEFTELIGLDGFDGVSSLDLRFRLTSDGSGRRDGAWIDDVTLRCLTGSHGTNDFVRFSGTSMAAPHVAGVTALLLSAYPDATVAELKAALLNGTDARSGLSGKVRSGGRLNARGALDELDVVRPVAAAPSQQLVGGSRLGATTVPLRVSWAAASDADPSSGIARYLVQRRSRIGSTWRAWKPVGNTSRLFLTVHTEPGTHQFRIQAIDRGGNRSAYRAGRRFTLADPQGGAAIQFVRTWSTQSSPDFFDGSTRWSRVLRASAAHTFTGRQVAWVSSRASDRGRAKVYIDGAHVATVDLYRGSRRDRRVVFETSWDTPGTHTIKIKVIAKGSLSSGPRVDLDAFITLS